MIRVAVFIVVSVGLVYVSRASLAAPRSHGFYRFFAWEAILALVLWNAPAWFRDPFTWRQIVSWTCLAISAVLAVHGMHLLRSAGRPRAGRSGEALLGIEKTTELVTAGAYRYIRHPLYSSLLFLGWGAFLKAPSWPGGVLAFMATLFLVATAKVEERENIRYFGTAYESYTRRTKMFIPYVL